MKLTLDFQSDPALPLDASALHPESLLPLPVSEISRLQVDAGRERIPLGDLCRIQKEQDGEDCILFAGHTARLHRLGWELNAGRMIVMGSAGRWAAAGMSGGELFIHGNAGDNAGVGMSGGILNISGSAGERLGGAKTGGIAGMKGGVILVGGDSGAYTGERMRRGLIYCAGNIGKLCGLGMLAGSILAGGRLGEAAGLRMRRGSIVAGSSEPLLPGFHNSGAFTFGWLSLACNWLRELGATVPNEWKTGRFRKYSGHDLELNKGEILIYDPDQ